MQNAFSWFSLLLRAVDNRAQALFRSLSETWVRITLLIT